MEMEIGLSEAGPGSGVLLVQKYKRKRRNKLGIEERLRERRLYFAYKLNALCMSKGFDFNTCYCSFNTTARFYYRFIMLRLNNWFRYSLPYTS